MANNNFATMTPAEQEAFLAGSRSAGGGGYFKAPVGTFKAKLLKASATESFGAQKPQLKLEFQVTEVIECEEEAIGSQFSWFFTKTEDAKFIEINNGIMTILAMRLGLDPKEIWYEEKITQELLYAYWSAEATKGIGRKQLKDVDIELFSKVSKGKTYINAQLAPISAPTAPASDY
jgi:hypothetical protein